jgi:hypothetical protein
VEWGLDARVSIEINPGALPLQFQHGFFRLGGRHPARSGSLTPTQLARVGRTPPKRATTSLAASVDPTETRKSMADDPVINRRGRSLRANFFAPLSRTE